MFRRLWKSKTFWTGIAGIITAVGAYMAGEISLGVLLTTSLTALLAIFVRDGIAKNGTSGPSA